MDETTARSPGPFDRSRWIQPQTLTVFCGLPDAEVAPLRAELPLAAGELALERLECLHVLRLFVIEAADDLRGRRLPARLVLSAVFDGTAAAFLDRWIALAGPRLSALFARCTGSPAAGDDRALRDWLLQHAQRPQTYYIGTVGRRAAEIREGARLRAAIGAFIDAQQAAGIWTHGDPVRIREEIRAFVRTRPDLPQGPRPPKPWAARALQALDLARILVMALVLPAVLAWLCLPAARHSAGVFVLATGLIALGLVVGGFLVVRLYERLEPDVRVEPRPGEVARLVAMEDRGIQNQFTMLTPVRGSMFRRLNLRLILWLSDTFSRHYWNRGELVGIGTIHFARIHQIDGGRRMLFMSDFDGSWERYLFDFLDVGGLAVVPIWTNLHGCPKARFALWPPRGFAQRFLPFTRANQLPSDLWFSALDHLTVAEILRDARIRDGLFRPLGAAQTRRWLQLF